jgi:hypothetical protein
MAASKPDEIRKACEDAAANGLGWLADNSHSLQLHRSLIERLPSVLRAYVSCGLVLWDNISDFQLIKIHALSGKLTLLQYENFDTHAIPKLTKRIKINLVKLDYDVFEYEAPNFPPPPLLYKSRFMHEDLEGYGEQLEFDDQLESLKILDEYDQFPTVQQIDDALTLRRLEISGLKLQKSTSIPPLDQRCGKHLTFKDLIHCGQTQSRLGIPNLPKSPNTYNALYLLSTEVLDPIIDYFGSIKLTYGFCSQELSGKITSRIAPKLDQHASHECNKRGNPICDRLGAAADFIISDEDMLEVAAWIAENLNFDRMYIYGRANSIHISHSANTSNLVTFMIPSPRGRLIPRSCRASEISKIISNMKDF